jgi:hypothetical protein
MRCCVIKAWLERVDIEAGTLQIDLMEKIA